MPKYSAIASERAMKVKEVILWGMAKKITWWRAAEIIGLSDRIMCGAGGSATRSTLRRAAGSAVGEAEPEASSPGAGRRSVAVISGEVCRPERAAFSREAAGRARNRVELHVSQAGAARGGAGEEGGGSGGCIGSGEHRLPHSRARAVELHDSRRHGVQQAKTTEVKTLRAVISGVDNPHSSSNEEGGGLSSRGIGFLSLGCGI
jgi:hypothetical protein